MSAVNISTVSPSGSSIIIFKGRGQSQHEEFKQQEIMSRYTVRFQLWSPARVWCRSPKCQRKASMTHGVSLEFVLFLEVDAGNGIDTEESGVEAQIQQVMKSPAKLTGQIDNFRHFYSC